MEAKLPFARLLQVAALAVSVAVGVQAEAAPVAYGTYYDDQSVSASGCSGVTLCRTNFSQLSSDKLFNLTKVNCQVQSNQPLIFGFVSAAATSGGGSVGRSVNFSLGAATVAASNYFYSFESDANFLIGQGRFPYIEVVPVTTANIILNCGIRGDLVPPIQ